MKRNLNIVAKQRDGSPFTDGKSPQVYADFIVTALDRFVGTKEGVTKREIGKLADRIYEAKSSKKDVELTPGDVELIVAALDPAYIPIIVNQIAKHLEAK